MVTPRQPFLILLAVMLAAGAVARIASGASHTTGVAYRFAAPTATPAPASLSSPSAAQSVNDGPTGVWIAFATVTDSTDPSFEQRGERLQRTWDFYRYCPNGRCGTYLRREMPGGAWIARLVADGPRTWVATYWLRGSPCRLPDQSVVDEYERESFTIRLSADGHRITASEVHTWAAPGCDSGHTLLDWSAAQTLPAAAPTGTSS